MASSILSACSPVSYTHLDVYKRQTKGRQATSATEATITTEYSFPKLSRSPSVPTATTAKTNARSMRASMTRRDPDSVVSMEDTATVDAYTEDTMQENTKTTARSFQNDFGSDRREWSRTRVGVGCSIWRENLSLIHISLGPICS